VRLEGACALAHRVLEERVAWILESFGDDSDGFRFEDVAGRHNSLEPYTRILVAHPLVQEALRAARRTLGVAPHRRVQAAVSDIVRRLLLGLDDSPRHRRDRALLTLTGRGAEICAQIANLAPTQLPTLLDIQQTVEQHELHGDSAIDAAIAALPEPRPIKIRHLKQLPGAVIDGNVAELPPLEQVTPEQLFARMFEAKHKEPPADHLLELFRTISAGEKGSR
jgi:hypothetical protein